MDKEAFLAELHKQLLDVRMNQKYHSALEDRLSKIDRGAKILGALSGSAAVASFTWWKLSWGQTLWLVLTSVAAIVNTISAALGPADAARKHAALRQRFTALRSSIESLRFEVQQITEWPSARVNERFQQLIGERRSIEAEQPPPNRRVLEKAYANVLVEDGHSPTLERQRLPAGK